MYMVRVMISKKYAALNMVEICQHGILFDRYTFIFLDSHTLITVLMCL